MTPEPDAEQPTADAEQPAADAEQPEADPAARRSPRQPRPGSRMTEQEQRWGKWLGLGSAVAFGVVAQPWLGGEHLVQAGLGVAMGMLLWTVARQGFRIRTAVASYLFLFAFGDFFLLGAVHIGYAFLLAFRASREMGQARADERARERAGRSAGRSSKASSRRRKAKANGGDDAAEGPPPLRVTEPNRRYTPPRPKGKRRR